MLHTDLCVSCQLAFAKRSIVCYEGRDFVVGDLFLWDKFLFWDRSLSMRRLVSGVLVGVLFLSFVAGTCSVPAKAAETHRYIWIPLYSVLSDIDDDEAWVLNDYVVMYLIALDMGFTYLEGPEIPENWLDDPDTFAAVMSQMKRWDFASHTQGYNLVYTNDRYRIGSTVVDSIAYPPTFSTPEELSLCRIGGFFYFAWVYAGINTGNIISDFGTTMGWRDMPGRTEIIFRRNFRSYKVMTYDPIADPDGEKVFVREVILEIVNNATEHQDFTIESRGEYRHSSGVDPFPSTAEPVDYWVSTIGQIRKCNMQIERDQWWWRFFEPALTSHPIRDPSTDICPDDEYVWYLPQILPMLHPFFTNDTGELCHDVDTIVELDSGMWWNPYGSSFFEVLNPTPFDDATARAWMFLHIATNNGHRLIDTVNPVDGGGAEIPSIVDVQAFDPDLYPGTFEGGPKIHGYHKKQISPTVSALYKLIQDIYNTDPPAQYALMGAFSANLGSLISDVHIYVMDPDNPEAKTEINVLELLQMIADSWDSSATYSLWPPAFLWTDIPEIDRGQGPPVTFEITCTFDTNPTPGGGGPYVPMRIIANAHEGYYITNFYGDILYAAISGLLGGSGGLLGN